METNKMKQTYEAPELKVVAFQVEKGFAESGTTPTSDNLDEYDREDANSWF